MSDQRLGAAFRAVRIRRRWRQTDVATRAGVSRAFISLIERGHIDRVSLGTLRLVAAVLDIRIDIVARWRGGELDRLINARHSALHEAVAISFGALPGWTLRPEVSFAIYGERGVIDIVAWHASSGSLIIIELKSDVIDIQEMVGTLDRKVRLAGQICRERGWPAPKTVSSWLILADQSSNRRRVTRHSAVLRAAFPTDGRAMRRWLNDPAGSVAALSFMAYANLGGAKSVLGGTQRVRRPSVAVAERGPTGSAVPDLDNATGESTMADDSRLFADSAVGSGVSQRNSPASHITP